MPALRVLLLEDSAYDAELLGESLKAARPALKLTWVQDKAGFLAALKAEPPFDVLLSDFQIPGFSGEEALELAQRTVPDTPFIFVSGVIGEENAIDLLKKGATDYVIKGRLLRLPMVIDRAIEEVRTRAARRLAEAQFREADALYRRVVDSLQDYAVILLDADGAIRSCNRAGHVMFGYSAEAIAGLSADALLSEADRVGGLRVRLLGEAARKGSARAELWLRRADGSTLRGDLVVTPVLDSGGSAPSSYSMLVRDSTEAWGASEALRAAKLEAERASEAKDRFLAILSHELRTPLTPVATAAYVLERHASVPERYAHLLPMIRRNVALEARLIGDLLDITAISAGKVTLNPAPVSMHALVRSVIDMLESDLAIKRQHLDLQLRARDDIVEGDEQRLHQVVWNVLRNAVKFTGEGGHIELRTDSDGKEFWLQCIDDGIGIGAEALPRIFTAFEQADVEVRRRFGGLGLGLSIAKALTVQHGGALTADSKGAGQGATFELRLPLPIAVQPPSSSPSSFPSSPLKRLDDARQGEAARPEMASVEPGGGGAHILLVEDSLDSAEALCDVLDSYGYRVTHAPTLADAGRQLESQSFDLVLTDLGLPDGNGLSMRARAPQDVPVIALSGFGTVRDRQATKEAGFNAHLIKPVEPEVLQEALLAALGAARARA